jgi:RsiW-degrading membrane proteinase PrsW (M82 family)
MPIIFILLLIALYFLPSIIAAKKEKPNKTSILILNLFLGWTLIGWVVALIWAVSSNEPKAIVVQNQASHGSAHDLSSLFDLKEKGVITQEEFEIQKKKILG